MNLLNLLQDTLRDAPSIPDEAHWFDLWKARGLNEADSITIAVAGGALADRFAWVFLAGYQGALKALLGERMNGFAALVASEDRDDPEQHPGPVLTAQDDLLLMSGFKSWVAASASVEQLIVSARAPGQDRPRTWVSIGREQSGVTLSHRDKPGFLPQLSQGFAEFKNVQIAERDVLTGLSVGDFRHIESCHVRLAAAAFMYRHAAGNPSLQNLLGESVEACAALCADRGQLTPEITEPMDACAEQLAPELTGLPNYQSDHRLLTMYQPAKAQPPRA